MSVSAEALGGKPEWMREYETQGWQQFHHHRDSPMFESGETVWFKNIPYSEHLLDGYKGQIVIKLCITPLDALAYSLSAPQAPQSLHVAPTSRDHTFRIACYDEVTVRNSIGSYVEGAELSMETLLESLSAFALADVVIAGTVTTKGELHFEFYIADKGTATIQRLLVAEICSSLLRKFLHMDNSPPNRTPRSYDVIMDDYVMYGVMDTANMKELERDPDLRGPPRDLGKRAELMINDSRSPLYPLTFNGKFRVAGTMMQPSKTVATSLQWTLTLEET